LRVLPRAAARSPDGLRADSFKVSEGISCESCHGPAESWLRTHTRPDYTHADRVAIGMRDLKNLYVRANTCVACHQTVALPLLKAGHPGADVRVGRPVRVAAQATGGSNQLAMALKPGWWGKLAALREMSWQLSRSPAKDEKLAMRCDALLWVVSKLADLNSYFPELEVLGAQSSAPNYRAVQSSADLLAKRASEASWSAAMTFSILNALAKSGADFRRPEVPAEQHARRADRLVLALDRLLASLPEPSADTKLKRIIQTLPISARFRSSPIQRSFGRIPPESLESSSKSESGDGQTRQMVPVVGLEVATTMVRRRL